MNKKDNSFIIIISLIAIVMIIQACSLPSTQKTDIPAEVVIATEQKETEELVQASVEVTKETEVEIQVEQPTNTSEPATATSTLEPSETPTPKPGALFGEAFYDENRDGVRQILEEPFYRFNYRIFYLSKGYCESEGELVDRKSTEVCREYYFGPLEPGVYCLSMNDMLYVTTKLPMDIYIDDGGRYRLDIGFYR